MIEKSSFWLRASGFGVLAFGLPTEFGIAEE